MLLRVLVLSATAAGLYGAVQLVTGEAERVSGPIADANDFAYLLASVLPFAVYLVLRDRVRGSGGCSARGCWCWR